MALSPQEQAMIDQELQGLGKLDLATELARANQPIVVPEAAPVAAPEAAPQAQPIPKPVAQAVTVEDPGSISSAIGRGVDTLQSNAGATMRVVGELTGSQYLQDYGDQIAKENAIEREQYGKAPVTSYKDVTDLGTTTDFLKNMVGEAMPSLSTVVAGAAAGARVGGSGAGKVVGGAVGSLLASMGINIGALDNQMKEMDPESSHPWTAFLGGTGLAAVDAVGAGVVAKPLLPLLGKSGAYNMLIQSGFPKATAIEAISLASKHAAVSGLAEGATSALQQVGQDQLAMGATGVKIDPSQLIDNAINAAIGGTALGAPAGAISSAVGTIGQNNNAVDSAYVPTQKAATPKDFEPTGLGRRIWQEGGSEATALLKPLAAASPVAKDFVETFRADMTGQTGSKKTIFEDQELTAGKWKGELDQITRGKSSDELNKIFDDASGTNPTTPEALAVRKVLDDVRNEAINRGELTVGKIKDYMPFTLDEAKVDTPEFLQDITPHFSSPQAAKKAVDEWKAEMANEDRGNTAPEVKNLQTLDPATGLWVTQKSQQVGGKADTQRSKFAQSSAVPKFGQLEESRAFGSVPQNVLNKYTKSQTGKERRKELLDYFEGASHRIAYAERFGINGEKANAQITSAVAEAQAAGKKVSKEEVDRMYNLVNAYNGMYGRIKNQQIKNISGAVSSGVTASRLALAGLSTFTEFSIPFAKAGVTTSLAQVMPTIGEAIRQSVGKIFSSVPPSETGRLMNDLNMSLESTTSLAAERIGANMFNTLGQKIVRMEFLVNGMSAVTHVNRIFATKVAESVWTNNLSDMAAGLPFSSANGTQKLNQLREMGVDIKSPQEALNLLSPRTPSEVLAAQNLKNLAIRRFVDQSVLDPTFADKPMWMNNGMVQMAGLLKGYPAAYGNIILPMMMRRMTPSFAGSWSNVGAASAGIAFSLGLMLSLGYIQDELKNGLKFAGASRDDTRTPEQQFADVVMQQAPLQLSMVWDMLSAKRRGSTAVEALAGPVAGFAGETADAAYKTIGSFFDDPTLGHVWEYMYKQTPARPFLAGKEALNELSGLND
ncbi:virion structural protein [Pseudomonas phage NV1]|uniref:Putative structural protein n=1 Tax=Pseudomonas phage NV1 TaxID=2079543 RepID=A0A2L0HPY2_9CAUD|nr:virion structural protein [Pseudomonas phage NV1]AUX83674.1 putative structural protein [Pseudomonas phage NV1]